MRERMGSVDAAWFRMDRPENTADVVSLLTFRRLPPVARIRALIDERLLCVPRFRQRAVRGGALGGDRWEDDPHFDLDRHLVRHRLPARQEGQGHDGEALRALVSEICTERLDPDRPLWRIHLASGGGEGAIIVKIHHAVADGFALVAVLLGLADEPPAAAPHERALAAYRRLEPWLEPEALLRSIRHPGAVLRMAADGLGMATGLARMTVLPMDPATPLTRALSGERRAAWSHGLPLAQVREAARAHRGTVNDLIMAAVAGALRGHLAARGEKLEGVALRALVPVNLRPGLPHGGPDALGNRFGLIFLDLPTDLDSPHARLHAMRARTVEAKRRPDALTTFGVLGALGFVPAVAPWAFEFFSGKASLVMTNVPGPQEPLYLAGHRVEHAMFWVPHPSTLGLGISVLSYAGEVRIGVRADVAVMDDPADLVTRFEQELAALGAGAPAQAQRLA